MWKVFQIWEIAFDNLNIWSIVYICNVFSDISLDSLIETIEQLDIVHHSF